MTTGRNPEFERTLRHRQERYSASKNLMKERGLDNPLVRTSEEQDELDANYDAATESNAHFQEVQEVLKFLRLTNHSWDGYEAKRQEQVRKQTADLFDVREKELAEQVRDDKIEFIYPCDHFDLGDEREAEHEFVRTRRFVIVGTKLKRRPDHHHSTAYLRRKQTTVEGESVNPAVLAALDDLSYGSSVLFQGDDGFHYSATKVSNWKLEHVSSKIKIGTPKDILKDLVYLTRRKGSSFELEKLQAIYRKGYNRFHLVDGRQLDSRINICSEEFKADPSDGLRLCVNKAGWGNFGFHFVKETYWMLNHDGKTISQEEFAGVVDASEVVSYQDKGRTGLFRLPQNNGHAGLRNADCNHKGRLGRVSGKPERHEEVIVPYEVSSDFSASRIRVS